jgi:hypothetical protein
MASTPRILCAERGHMWGDESYFQEKNWKGLKIVWVLRLRCERSGCERVRVDHVMPKTFKLVSRRYEGDYERIGRLPREDLRQELISRTGVRV